MPVQSGSGPFFVLLAVVFFLYWALSSARLPRLAIVLFANYLFCAHYGLFYVVLMPACSTVDYLVGRGLMTAKGTAIRKLLVGSGNALVPDSDTGQSSCGRR